MGDLLLVRYHCFYTVGLATDVFQCFTNWFLYHSKVRDVNKSSEFSVVLPLPTIVKQKKPAAIAPWQAYSQLYFIKGTAFHAEVHSSYHDFKDGAESARSKYSHLFQNLNESTLSTIPWLQFYQAVMMECVKNANVDKLEAITQHIDNWYQNDITLGAKVHLPSGFGLS